MYSVVLLTATLAPGQNFIDQETIKNLPSKAAFNADARKDARDQVLRSVGQEALAFTKKFGDLGIYSLQQCEPATAKNLVKLFNDGELSRLKNLRAVLEAVRLYRDPAGQWVVEHHAKLEDPEALECWCKEPMEYVYDLRDVEQAAEELRASRKRIPSWLVTGSGEWNVPYLVIGGLVLLLLLALFWRRKQAPGNDNRAVATRSV